MNIKDFLEKKSLVHISSRVGNVSRLTTPMVVALNLKCGKVLNTREHIFEVILQPLNSYYVNLFTNYIDIKK